MPEPIAPTLDPPATPPTTPPTPPGPQPLDPANLPPEVQAIIDRERTQASKTARANALKDAATDPQIQAAVRAQLEKEAQMTADDRVAEKERELDQKQVALDIRTNTVAVESMLITNGIEKKAAVELAAALATADETASTAKATAFLTSFKAAVDAQVTTIKNELLANGGAPNNPGGGQPTSEEQYQAQYKAATEAGQTAVALSIQRRASAEGITVQ